MTVIESVATSLPTHKLAQTELRALAEAVLPDSEGKNSILDVFENSQIDERALAMPIEWYLQPHGFAERNREFNRVASVLVEEATVEALRQADLRPSAIDGVILVSTTGISTPSLDVRLANQIGLRTDIARVPLFGLGCAGGVAGLARAADFTRADPEKRFLMVAVELCSLSFDMGTAAGGQSLDKKSLVSASLFGDGCAAVVLSGQETKAEGPRLTASASHLFPDTERVMGWDVEDTHFEVVLSPKIPSLVEREIQGVVQPFLERHLDGKRPTRWVLHPGGARVIDAYAKAMELSPEDLAFTKETLRAHGNMSSPTVLFALEKMLKSGFGEGESALLAALGPGFAGELALLEG